MPAQRFLNALVIGFFLAVTFVVFWQIETDFKAQGIASGGPYDNAGSFPKALAIIIGILLVIQLFVDRTQQENIPAKENLLTSDLLRSGSMLLVFAIYLLTLTSLGYHLATTPLIFAVMFICGMRNFIKLFFASLVISTSVAFVFEVFLNVVLPLGLWSIYIPW